MSKIRVMIVDDAVVIRKLVSDVLAADPDIEVVGSAATGKIALAKIPQVNPDLVTLDMEMPDMDGPATLRELRKTYPKLPVIMFSTLTARGAAATLDALASGANDYVAKPSHVGNFSAAIESIRAELLPKIKGLCRPEAEHHVAPPPKAAAKPVASPLQIAGRAAMFDAVVIGVSTGGPNALAEVIPGISQSLPVPILIVQHMPPVFTRLLAERLHQKSRVPVKEAEDGEAVEPGKVYIAPGDYHMEVIRIGGKAKLKLNQQPPENSCRPAVDVLFRSAASCYAAGTLAVMLTGMGQDGLRGTRDIRERGGQILAQDEATCVVWGMPGAIVEAGLADAVLPLGSIATEINRRVVDSRTPKKKSA